MKRFMVFDHLDNFVCEVSPNDVMGMARIENVNGERSLEITTIQKLEKNQRIVFQDNRGYWREYVVVGVDEEHHQGARVIGTYYCVWSLQPDMMGTRVSRMPGTETPVAASVALDAALSGTSRWAHGTVTNTNTGGASMYDTDGWDALSILVANWGGEIDATIEVGGSGVTARKVDLYSQMGSSTALRRLDIGADFSSIKRIYSDEPFYCRITPRGKGEEADTGGYGRKITIESVNGGLDFLENSAMVDLAKLPDGNGGFEYPTLEVENPDCTTPTELLAWARSVLDDYTLPKITYEIDAFQSAIEGVDVQGVSLGDVVDIIDRKWDLQLTGRVVSMTVDELTEKTAQLTIGYIGNSIASTLDSLKSSLDGLTGTVQIMNGGTLSTADYLSRLLSRINTDINATGGYTYITEGQGIRTYDRAVTDPLIGSEANAVVEVKGGTIRIANTKTAQGAWEWKTVFTSGHIAAELVTAVNVTAGRIESANGQSYWDLDGNHFVTNDADLTGKVTATSGSVGGMTIEQNQLSNLLMVLRDNGLLFKRRDSSETCGSIISVKGTGDMSGAHGVLFGSFVNSEYQIIGLASSMRDNGPNVEMTTGSPILLYTTKSGELNYKNYYANRLNFPIDLEIMDGTNIYLPYKSGSQTYHDYGHTQNVTVGGVVLKFRKGLFVGTG